MVRALDSPLHGRQFDSRPPRLILGRVTVFGRANHFSISPSHPGQLSLLPLQDGETNTGQSAVRPMLSVRCPVSLSVCLCLSVCLVCLFVTFMHWPNGSTDQDETRHAGRPRPWPYCVRWGHSFPSPKGAQPPNFRPISVAAK